MEKLPAGWLSEFQRKEEEDRVLTDGMNSLDDFSPEQYAVLYNEDFQDILGTVSNINIEPQICYERPRKQLKSSTSDSWSSGGSEQKLDADAVLKEAPKSGGRKKRAGNPSVRPTGTHEHVIAERERRGKLSQQFIALSALVPGLTKINKATVLGACITYVKQLQTRVEELEERTSKKTMESAIFVKKFQVSSDTDSSSLTDKSTTDFLIEQLPKVEARILDDNIQIRVHCEKRRGAMTQILLEIENLNLNVVTSSVLPFGSSTFDMIVMAQMNAGCNMTVKDLVKKLGLSIV